MILDRDRETDISKCQELSCIYKRYLHLVNELIHTENDGLIDTEKVKLALLDIQNSIHDDLIKIITLEGVNA